MSLSSMVQLERRKIYLTLENTCAEVSGEELHAAIYQQWHAIDVRPKFNLCSRVDLRHLKLLSNQQERNTLARHDKHVIESADESLIKKAEYKKKPEAYSEREI